MKDIPQEHCLVPQIREQSFEVIKVIPQERVSVRIVEQTVDILVPQIMDEIVAAARSLKKIKDIRQKPFFERSRSSM